MNHTKIDIKDGHITFGRKGANNLISNSDDGTFMLSLEEWKAAKTWKQIKFAHVCFDKYSDYTGYTFDEAKDNLKKWYGFNRLYKDKRTGKQELLIRSLADYTKEQMITFIDRMLNHFEMDCDFIIDPELRKQFEIDHETGELTELAT